MKRITLVLLSLALLACTGCGKQEDVTVEIDMEGDKTQSVNIPDGDMPTGEMPTGEMPSGEKPSGAGGKRGDESAKGEGGAEGASVLSENEGESVIGKVESIVGNRATLLLGEASGDSVTYGEETAIYLLPVGMTIGTGDFSSVTKGMVLKLWIANKGTDAENITAVSIVSR